MEGALDEVVCTFGKNDYNLNPVNGNPEHFTKVIGDGTPERSGTKSDVTAPSR